MINKQPTLRLVKNVLQELKGLFLNGYEISGEYLGDYQERVVKHILDNDECIIMVARQAGKTLLAALIATCYILCGHRVAVALPTKQQGQEQITKYIKEMVLYLASKAKYAPLLKPTANNVNGIKCVNGGGLFILSTHPDAQREGYSASLLIIDEAHNAEIDVMGQLTPILSVANREKIGKLILIGVGGHLDKLLEVCKREKEFPTIEVTGDDIVKDYPKYAISMDADKRRLPLDQFDQMYNLKPLLHGESFIFPNLEPITKPNKNPEYFFGIDLGKMRDRTVVTCLAAYGNVLIVEGFLELNRLRYTEQVEQVINYISQYHYIQNRIFLEINGVGQGVIEMFQHKWPDISGYNLSKGTKNYNIVDMFRTLVDENRFYIEPDSFRNHIQGLTYTIGSDYRIKFQHSDKFSSLIMAVLAYANDRGI